MNTKIVKYLITLTAVLCCTMTTTKEEAWKLMAELYRGLRLSLGWQVDSRSCLKRTGDARRSEEKDNHSLFHERLNGVVINTDDWYDLFGVKPGDKLYLAPEKRARIW